MDNNYDVVIKSHPKDYHKLELVVDSIKYLNPQPENIYILTPDGFYPKNTQYDSKIIYITDTEVTPFIDKTKLTHRPNWNWINLVSLFQTFTKNDLYFDIQSDNFFTKPLDLFDKFGRPRIFQSISNDCNMSGHDPYFKFSETVFGISKLNQGYTYIIEFIMYDKKILSKLIDMYESFDIMMETIYNSVNFDSYPADQEIFGYFVEKYFSDQYEIVPNNSVYVDGTYHQSASLEDLKKLIEQVKVNHPDYLACSHHTWI